MKRVNQNFIVDLAGFLVFVSLIFTGVLLRYVLPPGSGGRLWRPGRGMDGNVIKTFWAMTRHQWGDVHFYLSIAFVVIMMLHIALHYKWLKEYFKSSVR